MIWLYRLQQRLAITRNESIAILTLAGLLLLGLVVQQSTEPAPSHDPAKYAEMEAQFRAHVARLPGTNRQEGGSQRGEARRNAVTKRINLNTASNAELQRLPGIGPALASRIEAYRSKHGAFVRVESLVRVRGIGSKTLAQLQPMVTVGGAP